MVLCPTSPLICFEPQVVHFPPSSPDETLTLLNFLRLHAAEFMLYSRAAELFANVGARRALMDPHIDYRLLDLAARVLWPAFDSGRLSARLATSCALALLRIGAISVSFVGAQNSVVTSCPRVKDVVLQLNLVEGLHLMVVVLRVLYVYLCRMSDWRPW